MRNQYIGTDLVELVQHLIEQRVSGLSIGLGGTITSVDPTTYRAKVMLDLAGTETGWLPIGALLSGVDYGVMALPVDGTHVTVLFEGGDGHGADQYNTGKILLADFNAVDTVPTTTLKPGEILMQSVGNASVKMDAQGVITFNDGMLKVARETDTVTVPINYTGTTSDGATFTINTTLTGTIQSGNATVKA